MTSDYIKGCRKGQKVKLYVQLLIHIDTQVLKSHVDKMMEV